jgi:sortase A
MGNKGLVLDGNTGGTPTDNSGEPGAVLRIVLVAAGFLPAGATLRRGRERDSAVRLPDLTHRFEGDPLLKVGAGAMLLALGFAIVVAVAAFLDRPIESAAAKPEVKSATEPLVRSDPDVDPWVEKAIPPPRSQATPIPARPSESDKPPDPRPGPPSESGYGYGASPDQSRQTLPLQRNDYPLPTDEQLRAANRPRHYNLPPGAIMSLSIRSMGLQNVPVLSSNTTRALDQGVIHLPGTSLPWSDTSERNVYLAGHRLGWPGTGSHLVFYRLNEVGGGERVTLRDPEGGRYHYRVIESFVVGAEDRWVTGRVRGRDLLTLQICTLIPTFEKRLIVRAERI